MESQKVRKSWFGTDRNPLCIASLDQDRPFLTVLQSYLIKKQSESDQITTQDVSFGKFVFLSLNLLHK